MWQCGALAALWDGKMGEEKRVSSVGMGVSLLNKTLSDKRDGLVAEHLQWCIEP